MSDTPFIMAKLRRTLSASGTLRPSRISLSATYGRRGTLTCKLFSSLLALHNDSVCRSPISDHYVYDILKIPVLYFTEISLVIIGLEVPSQTNKSLILDSASISK